TAQFAEATNEYGDVITSSPGPTPARRMQRWRPAVPDETAAQCSAPTASASARSKRGRAGRETAGAEHVEHELLLALVEPRRRELDPPCRGAQAARDMLGTGSRQS